MENIRAAAVQFQHAPGDKAANMEILRAFVHDAAAREVNLITFPEMCLTGYWHVRNLSREAIEALAEPRGRKGRGNLGRHSARSRHDSDVALRICLAGIGGWSADTTHLCLTRPRVRKWAHAW